MIRLHWNLTTLQFASTQINDEIEALYPLDEISLSHNFPKARIIDNKSIDPLIEALIEKGYSPRVEDP